MVGVRVWVMVTVAVCKLLRSKYRERIRQPESFCLVLFHTHENSAKTTSGRYLNDSKGNTPTEYGHTRT